MKGEGHAISNDRFGLLLALGNVRIREGSSTLANGNFAARIQR